MPERETAQEKREERHEYHRVEAFSDGVFAIAITLLVLGIDVPSVPGSDLSDAIGDVWPSIVSYFIGFAVIGVFWLSHHRLFSDLRRFDSALVWANIGYLSLVGLLPFSTALLGDYNEPLSVSVFAANVGLAATASIGMSLLARRRGLTAPNSDADKSPSLIRLIATPAVFFGSIPIAYIDARAAQWFWLAVPLSARLIRRVRDGGDASPPS